MIVVGIKIKKLTRFISGYTNSYEQLTAAVVLEAALYSDRDREPVQMVTATTGYRGRGTWTFARRPVAIFSVLLLLLRSQMADSVKRKHHWKADVIKNHLKNHKSLEGMARLVDGHSEYEGMNENTKKKKFKKSSGP